MPDLQDRDLRQRDIVPPEALQRCHATVVGTGAIGRQAALQLAAIGIPRMTLIDPDVVEVVNLAAQGFLVEDLGCTKVQAVGRICHAIHPALELHEEAGRFRRSSIQRTEEIGQVLFCCVDSITTRRHIWEAVKNQVDCFIDGRMAAEVIRILTAADSRSREYYPTTLFQAGEAYSGGGGGGCTAKTTIFTANIAAGLMLEQFSRWLRRLPIDADLQFNLLSSELSVAPGS